MNKIWLILFLATMTILAGCKSDDAFDYSDPDNYEKDAYNLIVNGRINKFNTRSGLANNGIVVNWGNTDNMAVFMKHENSITTASAAYDVIASTINNTSNSARFKGSLKWQEAKSRHDFYAYTPVITGKTIDPAALPVSVSASQKQEGASVDHINALDVMVAQPLILSSPKLFDDPSMNEPLNFMFDHVFTMQEFRFLAVGRQTNIRITKITLADADGRTLALDGGSIDLTQYASTDMYAKISGGVKSSSVVLDVAMAPNKYLPTTLNPTSTTDPNSGTPTNVFTARIMMLPGDFTPLLKGDKNIKLTIDVDIFDEQGNPETTKVIEIEYDGALYERGKRYASTYVLTRAGGSESIGDPGVAWDGVTATKPVVFSAATKTMEISTAPHLAWVAGIINCTIKDAAIPDSTLSGYTVTVTENINLGNKAWAPIGRTPKSGVYQNFSGTFDGNNKYITGFVINDQEINSLTRNVGLFGIARGATIKNVNVEGYINVKSIDGVIYTGGIVGYNPPTKNAVLGADSILRIINCSFSGDIKVISLASMSYTGGIVGFAPNSSSTFTQIDNCVNYANVEASIDRVTVLATLPTYAGGIVGGAHASVSNCLNLGDIKGDIGTSRLGGIAGHMNSHGFARVEMCVNYGEIIANGPHPTIGGVVGFLDKGFIVSSYNRGNMVHQSNGEEDKGDYYGVGGIVGTPVIGVIGHATYKSPTIRGCYNTGLIKTTLEDFKGNIFGRLKLASATGPDYSKIENNYYRNESFGSDLNASIVGAGLNGAVRFSSSKWPQATDAGWGIGTDVDAPWLDLGSYGGDYPILWWE